MNPSAHKTTPQNLAISWSFSRSYCNGKEKDYESGFHYYGARYYWSELLTGWLSIDPMMDKYPNISPYAYCAWNPLKLMDPDGRDTINVNIDKGTIERIEAAGDHCVNYFKNDKLADADPIKKDKCSFHTRTLDVCGDIDKETKYHSEYLLCSDIEIGESIFKKISKLGSPVEWDYYSMKQGYGELSSSGIADKIVHLKDLYTAKTVNFWDHYHPTNSPYSFFPSYADQDHARNLSGARCTIFFGGLSMDFNDLIPSHENGYISMQKFSKLWWRFAK